MDDKSRLHLQKMVKEYETEETTDKIRDVKHSKLIKQDVETMIHLKRKYTRMDTSTLLRMAQNQCGFLWKNYTNIFNKLFNDYLDLNILNKFIMILSKIENGKYDQHEASALVGQILKEIYIDSAIKEGDVKEKKRNGANKKKKQKKDNVKKISWKEFKNMNME